MSDAQLVFIGSNKLAQCLLPNPKILTPTVAPLGMLPASSRVQQVAAGKLHTLFLADNQLFAVGNNKYGQLGRGHSNDDDPDNRVPRPVIGFGDERITHIAAGFAHCAAVTGRGKVLLWGRNAYGQCGTGTAVGNVLTATRCDSGALADTDVRVVFVACGGNHTVALTSDGGVIAFGYNYHGQLGTGNNDSLQPTPVRLASAALAGVRIVGCAAGDNFTHLVSDDGRVFATGSNLNGQLGTGDTTNVNTPTEIDAAHFGGAPVAAVACGGYHTMAITRGEGKLYCWGRGWNGATGLGHTDDATTPQAVVGALADARTVRIAAGMLHSCALAEDGRVFAFGFCPGILAAGRQGTPQLLQEGALAGDITVSALSTGSSANHAAFITGKPPTTPGDGGVYENLRQLMFRLNALFKEGTELKLLSDLQPRKPNNARLSSLHLLLKTQMREVNDLQEQILKLGLRNGIDTTTVMLKVAKYKEHMKGKVKNAVAEAALKF